MWFNSFELACGRVCKVLDKLAMEAALECCKVSLMVNLGQKSEIRNQNADKNATNGDQAQMSSVRTEDYIYSQTPSRVCHALAIKMLSTLCYVQRPWETVRLREGY